jgi:hypothetical protein
VGVKKEPNETKPNPLSFVMSCHVIVIIVCRCACGEGAVFHRAVEMLGKQPPNFTATWQPKPVRSISACGVKCQQQAGCRAFFYNDVTKTCQMMSFRSQIKGDEIPVIGLRYYILGQ